MLHILGTHAHPDDVEILAGGTLAPLVDKGHSITLATFTPGDCGSRDQGPEANRVGAAARSCQCGTANQYPIPMVEIRDLTIFNDDCRRRVTEALRQTSPQIVLAASPVDYLCDHEATSVLARLLGGTACRLTAPQRPRARVLRQPQLFLRLVFRCAV